MPRKRKTPPRKRLRGVTIRAEQREQVDWDRFAWALLQHARLLSEQEKANHRKGKQ